MSDDQNANKDEPKFDAAKLKEDILSEQRQMSETMMNNLMAKVTSVIDEKLSANRDTGKKVTKKQEGELVDELATLGIDEDQAEAIVSLVKKRGGSVDSDDMEKKITEKISKGVEIKDKKKELEAATASKYPDVLNPNSRLWKEAQKIFNAFDENVRNSYMATSLAVESAANRLGVMPIDLSNVNAMQARNSTYGGGKGHVDEKKVTQKAIEFSKSFGVDAKIFEKHLKDKLQHIEK